MFKNTIFYYVTITLMLLHPILNASELPIKSNEPILLNGKNEEHIPFDAEKLELLTEQVIFWKKCHDDFHVKIGILAYALETAAEITRMATENSGTITSQLAKQLEHACKMNEDIKVLS